MWEEWGGITVPALCSVRVHPDLLCFALLSRPAQGPGRRGSCLHPSAARRCRRAAPTLVPGAPKRSCVPTGAAPKGGGEGRITPHTPLLGGMQRSREASPGFGEQKVKVSGGGGAGRCAPAHRRHLRLLRVRSPGAAGARGGQKQPAVAFWSPSGRGRNHGGILISCQSKQKCGEVSRYLLPLPAPVPGCCQGAVPGPGPHALGARSTRDPAPEQTRGSAAMENCYRPVAPV